MKILNTELKFDFNDANDMERLENAIEETQKKLNNMKTDDKRVSETIREICESIFNCIDKIFGVGTSSKIFGNKVNLNMCIEAFKDLIDARVEQDNKFAEELNNIEKKYSPNRATRRAKK